MIKNKNNITINDILRLEYKEQIVVSEEMVKIRIFRDSETINVFNIPTEFYTNNINVQIILNSNDILYELKYTEDCIKNIIRDINYILDSKYIGEIVYKYSLCANNVYPGCKIKIDNKLAVISDFTIDYKDSTITNLRYIPLKKDGTVSKLRPRLIYKNSNWKKL